MIFQLGPEVRKGRFGSLVPIHSARVETVAAGPTAGVDEGLPQAVLAMEPAVCPAEGSQVFLLMAQAKRGECGVGHGDRLYRLLVVRRLVHPVRIPSAIPNRPEDVLDLRYAVEKGERYVDYPKLYLDKWDEGTRRGRLTGVAANDCHHNQVFVVKMVDADTVLLGTNVDDEKQMRNVTAALRPGIKEMTKGRKPGDVLARVDMDPYAVSFRNAAIHVLAPKLNEAAVRAALMEGHAYVSHDWMCDATGFRFAASNSRGGPAGIMGDEVKLADGLKLIAKLPVPAYVRLLRYGKEVARSDGKADFEFTVKETGAYRLEAWLELDGELRPWIFSNPIYVR